MNPPIETPPGRPALSAADTFFAGGGEMRQRVREFDWASTPLGPIERWPMSLRSTVDTMLSSAFASIVLWGPELIQIYNDACIPIIGTKHPAALGRGNREIWPEVWGINGPIFARVLAGETITSEDALYPVARRGSGAEDLHLALSFSPVRGDDGEIDGALVTMFETTPRMNALDAERARLGRELDVERAHLEQVLEKAPAFLAVLRDMELAREFAEEARREAEEANHAKSAFLTMMSHELRTPLNAVTGYSDLLLIGVRGELTDGQREDVERIKRSGQYLLGLINDMLNFAKLESGQVEFRLQHVRLEPLLEGLADLIMPQVRSKGLDYRFIGCEGDPVVNVDPEKLRQILLNLLANAVKFTEPAGEVSLICRLDGGSVRMTVRDTGRGIPPDQLDRVFDPFVQVDRHLTPSSQQGVGLGLSISRDLAIGMSGRLEAESSVGEGSAFTLVLPRVL